MREGGKIRPQAEGTACGVCALETKMDGSGNFLPAPPQSSWGSHTVPSSGGERKKWGKNPG